MSKLGGLTVGAQHYPASTAVGRLYITNSAAGTTYVHVNAVYQTSVAGGSSNTLVYTDAGGNLYNGRLTKTSLHSGVYITADDVEMTVGRREKGTSGSFTTVQTYSPYTSNDYSCDFSLYDFLFTLTEGSGS